MKWLCVILLLLLSGCEPAPTILPHIRFIMDWYPGAEQGGFYAAQVMGFFKEEGLDVDILPGFPGADSLKLVSEEEADFGLGHSDFVLQQIGRNVRLITIYAYIPWNNQGLMIHAEDANIIKDIGDMGSRVWLIDPHAIFWKYLVQKYGLKDVRVIDNFSYIDEFITHPGFVQDICINDEPYLMGVKHQPFRFFPLRDIYPVQRVIVTRPDYLAKNPELVKKFLHAIKRGWQAYLHEDAAQTKTDAYMVKISPRLTQDYVNFNRDTLLKGSHVYDPMRGINWGEVDPATWNQMYNILTSIGEISHPFPPETGFTNQYVPLK